MEEKYTHLARQLLDDHQSVVTNLAEGFNECQKNVSVSFVLFVFSETFLEDWRWSLAGASTWLMSLAQNSNTDPYIHSAFTLDPKTCFVCKLHIFLEVASTFFNDSVCQINSCIFIANLSMMNHSKAKVIISTLGTV